MIDYNVIELSGWYKTTNPDLQYIYIDVDHLKYDSKHITVKSVLTDKMKIRFPKSDNEVCIENEYYIIIALDDISSIKFVGDQLLPDDFDLNFIQYFQDPANIVTIAIGTFIVRYGHRKILRQIGLTLETHIKNILSDTQYKFIIYQLSQYFDINVSDTKQIHTLLDGDFTYTQIITQYLDILDL